MEIWKFDFSITIITTDRPQNYLIQSIGYLFGEYGNKARPYIEICNVDQRYNEFLKEIQDHINIFNVSEKIQYDTESLDQRLEKEARDYWKCLQNSDRHSPFILLLEDDAVATLEFAKLIQSVISHLKSHDSIDYVKLYYPPRKCGNPAVFLIFIISLSFSWCLLYLSSFIQWSPNGGVYLSYPKSCCTQAVLFRTCRIAEIVSELSKIPGNIQLPKDKILDSSKFVGRSTDTNLFIHIGSYSSVLRKNVHLDDLVRGFELS
ncbi:unnamed protein product, partial [Mesorhabditis belari]|uniref:Uncharacterized protein n=1 Tax=Mesorhabditis belari TaxID=2138241 RepID=A0AAF3EXV4_9BILA